MTNFRDRQKQNIQSSGHIWDTLRNLVPFVQFRKHEKHRGLLLIKLQAEGQALLKVILLHGDFHVF